MSPLLVLIPWALILLLLLYFILSFIWLLFSDGDLTLMLAEKFGKKVESLRGRVIWVTGATSGIGEALVYRLARAGCKLAISARRDDVLQKVKRKCVDLGLSSEDVLVVPLDVADTSAHEAAFDAVLSHFNQLDILVNNAGRSQRAMWEKVDIRVDRELFEVNVFGLVNLSTVVLRYFLERGHGHLAVMSSVTGKFGFPASRSYTASKHALHGYFESLRLEKSHKNIDVTIFCPGPVFSNFLAAAATDQPGQSFGEGVRPGDKRMQTDRCADLCAIALANKLDETWISIQPILTVFYLAQYFPSLTRKFLIWYGFDRMMRMRDSRDSMQEK